MKIYSPFPSAVAALAAVLLVSRATGAPVVEQQGQEQDVLRALPVDLETASAHTPLPPPPPLPSVSSDATTIPSRHQSTLLARRLLALSTTGVLTSIFPANLSYPRTPADVAHTPIGLPEYIATCEGESGNPTILGLLISTTTKNAFAPGPLANVSLSLSWWDQYVQRTGKQPWSRADLPRLALTGYLEEIGDEDVKEQGVEACFVKAHKDSLMWLPGRKWAAHEGRWMRIVVQEAYWIGGFGDRNYIGWLSVDDWRGVGGDWKDVRLPGEE